MSILNSNCPVTQNSEHKTTCQKTGKVMKNFSVSLSAQYLNAGKPAFLFLAMSFSTYFKKHIVKKRALYYLTFVLPMQLGNMQLCVSHFEHSKLRRASIAEYVVSRPWWHFYATMMCHRGNEQAPCLCATYVFRCAPSATSEMVAIWKSYRE